MIEVRGKGAIARILKDSISPQGVRLTTMEIEVSRIVWCEFLTHGMLARNAHSSRAIPFDKMAANLTGKPVRFGKANKGMQDDGEHNELINGMYTPEEWWHLSKLSALNFARGYYEAGYAKQVYNRLTEAHQMVKAVVSATEWLNYYWLRDDIAADPTLEDLASTMRKAHEQSVPALLQPGMWHLPYIEEFRDTDGQQHFYVLDDTGIQVPLTVEQAIKVSSARTGAVSFRNVDYGLEQSLRVYDKLVGDVRKHASAMQHQATPILGGDIIYNNPADPKTWQQGVSHADRDGNLWSAQLKGWIMNRKLIPGENYQGEIK